MTGWEKRRKIEAGPPPSGVERGKLAHHLFFEWKRSIVMQYTIGVDLGTSGTKTVLFDQRANPVASATIEYPLYQPQNGWAEQDPEH